MLLFDDTLVPLAIATAVSSRPGSVLVVLPDSAELESTASSLTTLLQLTEEKRPLVPMPEVDSNRQVWIPENEAERCASLQNLIDKVPSIYLTTPSVLLSKTIAPKYFKSRSFTIRKGDAISPDELARRLVELDYDNEAEVIEPGEFSRRGGILDVYSPLYEAPIRIDFWGDEVDSLRFFMPDTQRSYKEAPELKIIPRGTAVLDAEEKYTSYVKDFFPKDITVFLIDPAAISAHVTTFGETDISARWKELVASYKKPIDFIIKADDGLAEADKVPSVRLSALSLAAELADTIPELGDGATVWHWQQLRDSIKRWVSTKYTVVACCSEKGEVDRFKQLLKEDASAAKLPIIIEHQPLSEGVMLPDARLVLLSSHELFGRKAKTRRKKLIDYKHDTALSGDVEIEEGSYVVHITHGIAIFRGIKQMEINGDIQEVMELEFADEVKLYVPLEEAFLVSRYLGAGKAQPVLSKISGVAWQNAKAKAEDAAFDLAAELIKTEAMRQASEGHSMKPVIEWETSFANSFPYKETPDQEEAIRAVLEDLENPKPMDRLLCGDVGYGKTEVALRAAFRAVLNGKQVALLVPTTILAQQHYQTFRERLAEYPVTIDLVSRFRSSKDIKEILAKTASGEIDILIGTHRIIQKDVHFRSLGLLIIDEEQRFGVAHKQRLKSMRADLDILTMTATPIPRTLYFSLSGIRNLSTIMTAPVDRLPVTTVVAMFDKELIRMAITREIERKGQVFFLYNRVATIDKMCNTVRQLVPQARCEFAHGQMGSGELEKVMVRFVRGEIDVLVCTTIIESGVDIPNVNTIIIDRADRFGLSELYQLRGRVGRHIRQAYAYLLLPPMGALPQNARERLAAIRRYTHLGAGFKLAMRDMEIRGAGNILGTEQSGHIAAVGFELYCQLLKDAVKGLTATQQKTPPRCKVFLDRITFAIESTSGKTPISFPPSYIPDLNERLAFYKKLNAVTTEPELEMLRAELVDRFGKLPQTTLDLLYFTSIRIQAQKLQLISASVTNGRILIETPKGLYRDSHAQVPVSNAHNGRQQIAELLSLLNKLR